MLGWSTYVEPRSYCDIWVERLSWGGDLVSSCKEFCCMKSWQFTRSPMHYYTPLGSMMWWGSKSFLRHHVPLMYVHFIVSSVPEAPLQENVNCVKHNQEILKQEDRINNAQDVTSRFQGMLFHAHIASQDVPSSDEIPSKMCWLNVFYLTRH